MRDLLIGLGALVCVCACAGVTDADAAGEEADASAGAAATEQSEPSGGAAPVSAQPPICRKIGNAYSYDTANGLTSAEYECPSDPNGTLGEWCEDLGRGFWRCYWH